MMWYSNMDKKFALMASFCIILVLGNLIYLPQITSQHKKSQDQYTELSEDFQILQEELESQLKESGPRYTGNPFATELWPGQLQSENITGMHWYSYYNGSLVNCTNNVLGLNGVGATKQIWASFSPRIGGDVIAVPTLLNTGQQDTAALLFVVPHDFTDWTDIKLIMRGGGQSTVNLYVKGYAGACGEATDIHNQTIVKDFVFGASGSFTCLDLLTEMTTFFEALSPGDYVEIRIITNEMTIVYAYGVDLRYN